MSPSEKPTEVTDKDWIFERPPESRLRSIIGECKEWHVKESKGYIDSGRIFPREIHSDDLITPTEEPDLTLRAIDVQALKSVDTKHDLGNLLLIGKWMLFPRMSEVDTVWRNLSKEIRDGNLPYDAKVSTAKQRRESKDSKSESHVICVYTMNYFYRKDVRKCREALRRLGFDTTLYYKPDIFTYQNRYRYTGSKINHRYYG